MCIVQVAAGQFHTRHEEKKNKTQTPPRKHTGRRTGGAGIKLAATGQQRSEFTVKAVKSDCEPYSPSFPFVSLYADVSIDVTVALTADLFLFYFYSESPITVMSIRANIVYGHPATKRKMTKKVILISVSGAYALRIR